MEAALVAARLLLSRGRASVTDAGCCVILSAARLAPLRGWHRHKPLRAGNGVQEQVASSLLGRSFVVPE